MSELPIAMEYLPVNGKWGQGYGYVLYRTLIPADTTKITVQGLRDYGVVGFVYQVTYYDTLEWYESPRACHVISCDDMATVYRSEVGCQVILSSLYVPTPRQW